MNTNTSMKGLLAGLFICLLSNWSPAEAQQKKGIQITGKVAFQNPEIFKKYNMVWLYKGLGKDRKAVDSVRLNADGSFSMTTKSPVSGIYSLDIIKWQSVSFWSDHDVNISARGYDTSGVKVKNSGYVSVSSKSAGTQLIGLADYNRYIADQEYEVLAAESIAAQQYARKDTTWASFLRSKGLIRRKADFELQKLKQLINTNAANPAVVYLLAQLPVDKESAFFSAELEKLITRFPNLEEAKQLKKEFLSQLALRNSLKKGSIIPQIVYSTPEGTKIDITSYKGKYVLIDFWASWCGPCRKAIPEIKELYAAYKNKGFDVLSVSVDTDNAAWRKAMDEEQMPWAQVISPDKNKTLADFMITGIPTLYLIDREGKIIDKYTGFSPKTKSQLEAIFKEKI
ncbi:TlpA family protein disulfide reductase [Pedobacter sp. GR22-6]|uniref:TlpA family protein disulfide reductase n=1 Tax=Pedobacter sp. GR22-6 TaxID=3127957 RepID=UPI00307EA6F4